MTAISLPPQRAAGASRLTTASFLAAGITVALFALMQALIADQAGPPPIAEERVPIVISERPDELETERPPRTPPQLEPAPVRPPATRIDIAQAAEPGFGDAGVYAPAIDLSNGVEMSVQVTLPPPPLDVRTAPLYPPNEHRRGVEGRCVVIYDILANGQTANARAGACDSRGFERASLAAVADWRHAVTPGQEGGSIVRRNVVVELEYALNN